MFLTLLCKVVRQRRIALVEGTVVLGQVRSRVEETAMGLARFSWKQESSLKNLCLYYTSTRSSC